MGHRPAEDADFQARIPHKTPSPMSAKKTAKKVPVKKVTKKVAPKALAKKVVKTVAKPSSASKKAPVKKVGTKKDGVVPSNVIPIPGKVSRFINKHGTALGDHAVKLLEEYGPAMAWKALDQGAKRSKGPLVKMALGFFRDVARELDDRNHK